ncbi:MAG: hypothetical protein V3V15_05795 [Sphingorhabdus sp.]
MADRVSASITIGGKITPAQFEELTVLIANEGLSLDWDSEPFAADQRAEGESLRLCAYDVPWGMFEALEQYCCGHNIAYTRWCGACPGNFGAERIVYDGKSRPYNYDVNDDDLIMLAVQTVEQLGSMRAIRAYLKPAAFEVPPLVIAD